MSNYKSKIGILITAGILSSAVTSCGGGNSASSDLSNGRSGTGSGILSLKITDAAVESVDQVWIKINGITLKHKDAPQQDFVVSKTINLLTLQGENFQSLFDAIEVQSGEYNWIKLNVSASLDGIMDSYVVEKNGTPYELEIPSGSESGLQINGGMFVGDGKATAQIIDFDLRKSIVISSGQYKLKPVLRLVNEESSGTISGSVDASLLSSTTLCSDADPNTFNAAYVYEGLDVAPDDIRGASSDPVTSASITLNPVSGKYEYTIGYVPYGDYTVAYTCQADLDNPEANDSIIFFGTHNVTVEQQINVVR